MTNTNEFRTIDRLRIDDKKPLQQVLTEKSGGILLGLMQGFRRQCWMASILVGVLVSACSTSPPILEDPEEPSGPRLVLITEGLLGLPYTYGSNEPDGFDCSGLVQYVHRQIGIWVPRTARAQFSAVKPVNFGHLQPGDLVFFRTRKQHVDHVGIFAGNGKFIHAPSAGKKISYSLLSQSYWKRRLVGAGRFY